MYIFSCNVCKYLILLQLIAVDSTQEEQCQIITVVAFLHVILSLAVWDFFNRPLAVAVLGPPLAYVVIDAYRKKPGKNKTD